AKTAVIGQIGAEEREAQKAKQAKAGGGKADAGAVLQAAKDSARALMLIRAYRVRGNLIADLDPLALDELKYHPELDPATYEFGEEDMDRPIFLDGVMGYETASLREIL